MHSFVRNYTAFHLSGQALYNAAIRSRLKGHSVTLLDNLFAKFWHIPLKQLCKLTGWSNFRWARILVIGGAVLLLLAFGVTHPPIWLIPIGLFAAPFLSQIVNASINEGEDAYLNGSPILCFKFDPASQALKVSFMLMTISGLAICSFQVMAGFPDYSLLLVSLYFGSMSGARYFRDDIQPPCNHLLKTMRDKFRYIFRTQELQPT